MLRMMERAISFSVAAVLAAMLLSAEPTWSGGDHGKKGAKQRITEAEAVNLQRQLFDALTAPDGHAMEALMADDDKSRQLPVALNFGGRAPPANSAFKW